MEKDLRFADAETVRWTEWGLQSYFPCCWVRRLSLFGLAIALTGIIYRWLGWIAVIGGLGYAAIGVAGRLHRLQKSGVLAVQLLFVIFAVGVLVAGVRRKDVVEPAGA